LEFCFFQWCRKKQHKKPSEEDQKWFINKVVTFCTLCKFFLQISDICSWWKTLIQLILEHINFSLLSSIP
jgi:hypothetical protein